VGGVTDKLRVAATAVTQTYDLGNWADGLHPFGETAISNSSPGRELRLMSLAAVARDWLRKRPARDSRGPSADEAIPAGDR